MNNLRKILMVIFILTLTLPIFAQATKERQARVYLATGDSLFTAKNFDKAIENYKLSLETFREAKNDLTPFDTEIKDVLFKLYAAGGNARNFELAAKYGEEFLKYDEANEAVVRNVAQIYRVGLKNNEKAIAVWKRYDDKFNSFTAKQEIAEIYSRNKDIENAIVWFNKALSMNKDADVLQKVASLYINNKEPQKAIKVYEDFIQTEPSRRDLGITYRNMGTLYKDINNVSKAIEKYELALEIDWDRNISLWLVSQYYDQQNFTRANNHVDAMLTRNARDNDAVYFKALMLHGDGKFAEAKIEFQKIVNHPTYGKSAQDFIKSIDSSN